jgi:putative transposase
MKGSRFSEEQTIGVLREHEAWAKTEEVCRRHGISSATFYIYGQLPRSKKVLVLFRP